MNLNYTGSLAQERMRFRSTTDVVVSNTNELFNAQTIYVPKRFAAQNILEWSDEFVSPERPAVLVAVVDNYVEVMTGDLLSQWQPIFRQDTNGDVVLYLVVFDDGVTDAWNVEAKTITYGPLTDAFTALFSFSYFKHLFDPHYDGRDVVIPVSPGTPAKMRVRFVNTTREGTFARQDVTFTNNEPGDEAVEGTITVKFTNASDGELTLPAGDYTYSDGESFTYTGTLDNDEVLPASAVSDGLVLDAITAGLDANQPGTGAVDISYINCTSPIPEGFSLAVDSVTPGTDATNAVLLEANTYRYDSGQKMWSITVPDDVYIGPNGGTFVVPNVQAETIGYDGAIDNAKDITGQFIAGVVPNPQLVVTTDNIYRGSNPGSGEAVSIPANTYVYNDDGKGFDISVPLETSMNPGTYSSQIEIVANSVGADLALGAHLLPNSYLDLRRITPALPEGIGVTLVSTTQGNDPVLTSTEAVSQYFDLSLALAYQCKLNIALSWMWSMVKISYDDKQPNPQDACWIRHATRAEQLDAIVGVDGVPSLLAAPRDRYYWAMLYMLDAQNTTVLVHSEPENIIPIVLASWFAERNSSGTFIGNKLSLLRLGGTKIKPLGWKSWLDSAVNENDAKGHEQLRDMNVGFLSTIADNTPQECYLSMARGIGDVDKGIPVTMQMIAKFCDYTCAQEAAKLITDTGTLTNPILTDDDAYQAIQRIVGRTLGRFAGTSGRIFNITMRFPDFAEAKKSRTTLSAASAWKAWYKDDLDTVEVSGGIIAE